MRLTSATWASVGAVLLSAAVVTGPGPRAVASLTGDDGSAVGVAPVVEQKKKYRLVWREEFTSRKLSKRWSPLAVGVGGRTCATGSQRMVKVESGKAGFSATVDTARGPSAACERRYLNSQIRSKQTFRYGRFSARIKFQRPRGMHAAFWLLPGGRAPSGVSPHDLPGSRGTEIDVAEYFGDDFASKRLGWKKGGIYCYVYWPRRNPDGSITSVKTGGYQKKAREVLGGRMPSDGYHVYTVEWTPSGYTFLVDGRKVSRLTVGVSRRPQHLLLSMLTSDWELPEIRTKDLPGTMKVDWVRAYQRS